MTSPGTAKPIIELRFPVHGKTLPADHGWPLYGALSRLQSTIHDSPEVRVGPIEGADWQGDGLLRLNNQSFLPIRLPASLNRQIFPIAGKSLDVQGHVLRLGIPATRMLRADDTLHARIIVLTHRPDWLSFEAELRRQLLALDVHADIHPGRRRILRVKGFKNIGFAVGLSGLSDAMSDTLLSLGVGSRKSLGAGFFTPGPLPRSAQASERDLGLEENS